MRARTVVPLLASLAALAAPAPSAARPAERPLVRSASGIVLVVGDSLAVGTEPFLAPLVAPRRVAWEARSGRTTPEGLLALRAGLARVTPQTVVISLGTNDGPDPARFANRISRVLAAVPLSACVVWATVIRPPRKGPYHALNSVLRRTARSDPRVVLVDWARAVASGRVALPDGVHPDRSGFRYRSRLLAAAVRRGC